MSNMHATWAQVVEMAKAAAVSPALYRALDLTIPIAWEGNYFAIGLNSTDGLYASSLKSSDHQLKIEQALRKLTNNRDLKLRVLDSPTLEAWNAFKATEVVAARLAEQQAARQTASPTQATDLATWDAVYDQLNRQWSTFEFRTLASGKGRFLQSAIGTIDEAMDTLGATDEQNERAFSRTLERIGSMTSTDPALVGYLLFERRRLAGK